ncbi:alpha-protein kinase 3-like isoform X2 [Scleropages formosus]|nr:alpha-protein kinase 3 isoform X2 [Scleropages formosus]
MNEFKIHQRFFAKLKQKAESKRRELDKSRRQDKENQPVPGSPERMPRKRRSPGRPDPAAPSSPRKGLPGLRPKLHNEEVENMTIELPNSFPTITREAASNDVSEEAEKKNAAQDLPCISDSLVVILPDSLIEEPLAKKKIKIRKGSAMPQNTGKSAEQGINEQSEGAMSLSQYLATEVHQSQVSEAKQNSRSLEVAMEVETDRVKAEQKQTTKIPRSPKVKSKTKAAKPKEPGPANIQSPLTSVLSSLRGIFFGNKKKNAEETEHYNTPGLEESSTPASPEVSIPNSLHAHETEQNQVNTEWRKIEEASLSNNDHVTETSSQTLPSHEPAADLIMHSSNTEPSALEVEMLPENQALVAQDLHAQESADRCEERRSPSPERFPVLGVEQLCTVTDDHNQTEEIAAPVTYELENDGILTQIHPPVEKWGSVAIAGPHNLHSRGEGSSEELEQIMFSHYKESTKSCTQSAVEEEAELETMGDADTSAQGGIPPVIIFTPDIAMDNLKVKDGIGSAEESRDGTWENTSVIMDRNTDLEEDTTLNKVEQNETSGISEFSSSLEVKFVDATQMRAMQKKSEMHAPQSQIKNVHESQHTNEEKYNHLLDVSQLQDPIIVPKIDSLKSKPKDVTELPSISVHDDQQCLQMSPGEVSEIAVSDMPAVVPSMTTHGSPIIQSIQNDLIQCPNKNITGEEPQQNRNTSNGRTSPEELNSEQGIEVDRNSVAFINVSYKDLLSSGRTEHEPSNINPPLIITPTVPCDNEEGTDDREVSHSSAMLTDEQQKSSEPTVERETSAQKISLTSPEGSTTPLRTVSESLANMTVPKIQVDSFMLTCKEPPAKEVALPVTCCEISPEQRRDSLTAIPAATAEELASGARRKIFTPKNKGDELGDAAEVEGRKEEVPIGQQTPHSPLVSQRKSTLEVPKHHEEIPREFETAKPSNSSAQKEKFNPFKAPQVIRKIRGEPFSDVSGHLKLWCQFFNVLSDSIIMWFRNEEEIAEIKIRAGDESQVALAVVQASSRDCGVYSCSIKNEYGTDSTDYLLSEDILSEFFLKEDLEVGEEVEMTPLVFAKGLVEPGYWGNKLFGRVMSEELHVGKSSSRKISRMKVIYGLEPVFESGSMCILKVQSPIAYGAQEEKTLTEKNLDIIKQDCKIQNTVREYCKIFSAEVRTMENFGPAPEVMPLYLMYRPANAVPYATVEAYLKGLYVKYCVSDATGRLVMRTVSEVEQKCCAFQHWIHQWTNGNLLVTQLEGVDLKITNVAVVTKSKGYQGLTDEGSPHVFEHFASLHQCNYYCGLLSLRTLKSADSVPQSGKTKASKSPLFTRKMGGMSSPQQSRKGSQSPQIAKKGTSSPKVTRKSELGDSKSAKQKSVEAE